MRNISRHTVNWNIVNKYVTPGFTVKATLLRKVGKLERHLAGIISGTPHLQALLEQMPKKGIFIARFTLRLPSHVLHAEKSAGDLLAAIELASDALFREVESLRSRLRRDHEWKRPAWRAQLKARKAIFSGTSAKDSEDRESASFESYLTDLNLPSRLRHGRNLLAPGRSGRAGMAEEA